MSTLRSSVTLRPVVGAAVADACDAVARLRLTVFAEWPYLYDGDLDYERWYLGHLGRTDGAVIVLAYDQDTVVGAATGMPLAREHEAFQSAMRDVGHDPKEWFYLAESVLLPAYRGQGVGHRFFDAREVHAHDLGFSRTCFCAVARPQAHALRDPSVRSLAPFWRGRGYTPVEGAVAHFSWQDIGDQEESEKPLQMWARDSATSRSDHEGRNSSSP